MNKGLFLLLLPALALAPCTESTLAADSASAVASTKSAPAKPRPDRSSKTGKPGAWSFGDANRSRKAWTLSISAESLHRKALGEKARRSNSVNTATGISNALDAAAKKNRADGLHLNIDQESTSWRGQHLPGHTLPDEHLPLESRHVVRALADVEAAEDLNISLGPKLILKNENQGRFADKSPDTELGMSMQFKLDF